MYSPTCLQTFLFSLFNEFLFNLLNYIILQLYSKHNGVPPIFGGSCKWPAGDLCQKNDLHQYLFTYVFSDISMISRHLFILHANYRFSILGACVAKRREDIIRQFGPDPLYQDARQLVSTSMSWYSEINSQVFRRHWAGKTRRESTLRRLWSG